MSRLRLSIVLSVAALVFSASPALAQRAGDRAGIPRVNLISGNPIGILFEWYNLEFEHAFSPTVSLAVAGSMFELDEDFASVDAIARYYPSARALRGFSIGLSGGIVNVDEGDCQQCDDGTTGTIGVRADYVWIMGRDQHFAAAAGIGAKRLLGDVAGVEGIPIARLSIGYAW